MMDLQEKLYSLYLDNLYITAKVVDLMTPIIQKYDGQALCTDLTNEVNDAIKDFCSAVDFNPPLFYYKRIYSVECGVDQVEFKLEYQDISVTDGYYRLVLPDGYEDCLMLFDRVEDKRSFMYKGKKIVINAELIIEGLKALQGQTNRLIGRLVNEHLKLKTYEDNFKMAQSKLEDLRAKMPVQLRNIFKEVI